MKKYTVILDRRNERKTITVEAMSYPGARISTGEQFPDWEIWLVKDASPSPLADAVEIARGSAAHYARAFRTLNYSRSET